MKRNRSLQTLSLALLLLGAYGCRDIEAIDAPPALEDLSRHDRARVELGQRLFFDPLLSADGSVSCASCHAPESAGADPRRVSIGVAGASGRRNAPSVFNVGYKEHLFWDGRANALEEQALIPLRAEGEMGAKDEDVLAYLAADAGYVTAVERAFPGEPLGIQHVARAIAAYERQLSAPSRVDAYLTGDESALNAAETRGAEFFRSNCAFCHDGPGVGGQRFEKLGDDTPWPADRTDDLGRFEVTGDDSDKLVFAVPQLRNVARTAPYFHDGSVETLEDAVRLMAKHQLGMSLADDDVADVVAFLSALSADPDPRLLVPPLPTR
jgi:cytochrome c peroxidase